MMQTCIKHLDVEAEYYFQEGCYITELSNSTDDPGLSIARARVEPGVTTKLHHLVETTERYVVIQGEGLVEIDYLPAKKVTTSDVVIIPPGCSQKITNCGEDDLIFLAICTPRFADSSYREL